MLIKNELENLNEEGVAGANEGDGFRGGGDHGPSSAANAAAGGGGGGAAAPKVGSKRGRDDDSDEEMEEEKGNPRFRGDDADSDGLGQGFVNVDKANYAILSNCLAVHFVVEGG